MLLDLPHLTDWFLLKSPFNQMNGNNKHTKFGTLKWDSLPNQAQNAARALGHTKATWDGDEWCETEDYSWYDLSSSQKEAASTLGWDAAAWDNQYEDYDWSQLPSFVQSAAESLGFTQQMWDDGEWPYSTEKSWYQFSQDEKSALYTLGYYGYIWE